MSNIDRASISHPHVQHLTEGWLLKESHGMLKKWDDRYLALDLSSRRILYYADEKKKDLRGEWILIANSSVKIDPASARPNTFTVTGISSNERGNSILRLASPSANEMFQATYTPFRVFILVLILFLFQWIAGINELIQSDPTLRSVYNSLFPAHILKTNHLCPILVIDCIGKENVTTLL